MDMQKFEQALASDLPDIDKLARTFDLVTQFYVVDYTHQVDLLRTLQDRPALEREQIKLELVKHMRRIFVDCFYRVAGKKPWYDESSD
jgi:hypothetical protein